MKSFKIRAIAFSVALMYILIQSNTVFARHDDERINIKTIHKVEVELSEAEHKVLKKANERNEKEIATLDPSIVDQTRDFLNRADDEGILHMILSSYRDEKKQNELFDKGESPAKFEESYHNYKRAIDVRPVNRKTGKRCEVDWKKLSRIGKECGFVWGGDFKNFVDLPHFEVYDEEVYKQIQEAVKRNR